MYDDLAALHPGAVYPVQESGTPEGGCLAELLLFEAGEKPDELSGGGEPGTGSRRAQPAAMQTAWRVPRTGSREAAPEDS